MAAMPAEPPSASAGTGWAHGPWVWLLAALLYAVAALPVVLRSEMPPLVLAMSALLAAGLVPLSVIDFRTERLPDWLTLPLAGAGILATWLIGAADMRWHLAAALAGFAIIFVTALVYRRIRRREGIGLGDGKLLAASGAWLGLGALPTVLLLACLVALVQALLVSVGTGRLDPARRLPFGPALAMATWVVWLYGPAY